MSARNSSRRKAPARSQSSSVSSARRPPLPHISERSLQLQSRVNTELSSRSNLEPSVYSSLPARFSRLSSLNTSRSQRSSSLPIKEEEKIIPVIDDENDFYATFDALRGMPRGKMMRFVSKGPVFLRTLFVDGFLDAEAIGKTAVSLSQQELLTYVTNMASEFNYYSSVMSAKNIPEVEEQIQKQIPLQRVTVWTKMENAPYLTSQTVTSALPIDETVCGVPFSDPKDYVTGDPGDFQKFSVNYDLPLVRGAKSMILLPIQDAQSNVIAVMQCIGIKNQITGEQTKFSDYFFEVFKILRDIIQKKFFNEKQKREIPSTVSTLFDNVQDADLNETVHDVSNFFMKNVPCEQCDIFEVDDRYRKLIRLSDGEVFDEKTGGVSFEAGSKSSIINVPHGFKPSSFNKDIDAKFVNHSILAKSLHKGRSHFVITLRAKPNTISFNNNDVQMFSEMSPLVCNALQTACFIKKQKERITELTREKEVIKITSDTLAAISTGGSDRYNALLNTAKEVFGCETLFVCVFDGRNMRYYPTNIVCKFEDCAAGFAYNYREPIWTREDSPKQKYSPLLYDQLKVHRKSTFCFPYRSNGRVVGAIELVNPKRDDINKEEMKNFANLTGAILHNYLQGNNNELYV